MTSEPNKPCEDKAAEQILIVEGKDDCNAIYQIASHFFPPQSFGIWAGGSDAVAIKNFGALCIGSTRPKTIGLVLDCNPATGLAGQAIANRWAQIAHRLNPFCRVPPRPDPNGTILEGGEDYPRVGIWLMPDNQSSGMLEDFLLSLVPPEAAAFAQETAREAKSKGHGTYKEAHESKAAAHTYLAWQDEPGKPLGLAVNAGFFEMQSPKAAAFTAWLSKLFQPRP